MATAGFAVFLKLATLTTFLLGVVVIVASSFTLVGVFHHEEAYEKENKNNMELLAKTNESLVLETEAEYGPKQGRIIPKFQTLKGEYRHVIMGCVFAVLIFAGIQMLTSLCTLVSCSKDSGSRGKLWLIIHFIIFLVLLICFLIPLTYDSSKGERFSEVHEIKSKIKSHFRNFGDKTLMENLTHDLTAFYVAVGINEGVLFILMLILSICLCTKCGTHKYEPIT